MKRGIVIFALLMLLIVPLVSAKITILSQYNEYYNYGDTLAIDGYILAEEAIDDDVRVILDCVEYGDEQTYSLITTPGQKVDFSALEIENFELPAGIDEQECNFEATYGPYSATSNSFTLTPELDAFFVLEDAELQLGTDFILTGYVFKLNGENVESGNAVVFVELEDGSLEYLGEVDIEDGSVYLSTPLENLESGTYSYGVMVTDDYGNNKEIEEYGTFVMDKSIQLTVELSADTVDPGDLLEVYGDIVSAGLEGLQVIVLFDQDYSAEIGENNTNYNAGFEVASDTAPGTHELKVKATDSYGNEGETSALLLVNQVPASLDNELSETEFHPGDALTATTKVYDQVGTEISGDLIITVLDPNDDELYSGQHASGEELEFVFAQYSIPGTYTYTSQLDYLEAVSELTVLEVSETSSYIDGEILYITNDGNIPYGDTVTVYLVDSSDPEDQMTYIIKEEVSLDPSGTTQVDLSEEVPSGQYEIVVDDNLGEPVDIEEEIAVEDTLGTFELEEDNRPFIKKVDQGLSSVTGAAIIDTSEQSKWPLVMLILAGIAVVGLLGILFYSKGGRWYDDLNNWLEQDQMPQQAKQAQQQGKEDIFDKGIEYNAPFRPLNPVDDEGNPIKEKLDPKKIPEEDQGFDTKTIEKPQEEPEPEVEEDDEQTQATRFWEDNAKKDKPVIDDLQDMDKDFIRRDQ